MSRRQARIVAAAAGALLAVALSLRLTPLRLPAPVVDPDPAPFGDSGWHFSHAAAAEGAYSEVVQGNVLSPTRSPPVRGDPPRDAEDRAPALRLSGLVRAEDGVVALIDAEPAIPGAELYRVGDSVGPYLLTEASDSVVVLWGRQGALVLVLDTVRGGLP